MKRCHNCGEEWTRLEQPGFKETCANCMGHLHACLNCKLYNPSADRCSSVTAECTGDRAGLNYCEEFEFRDMPNNSNRRTASGAGKSLGFDAKGGVEGDSSPKSSSANRDKFNRLFGD